MEYKDITLFALGLAGILFHCLLKISQLKKDNKFKVSVYFAAEWPTLSISLVAVLVAIVLKNEITRLQAAGQYLGLAFVSIGYMAQSVLVTLMGKAANIIGIKEENKEQ